MKNTRLTSILGSSLIAFALSIGSLVATQSASAQSSSVAEVNIPFAFHTPTQTLPAGTYRVDRNGMILILKSSDKAGFVLTHDVIKNQAPTRSYVVFKHYGDNYYLEQIWTAGQNNGIECPKGRAEKESMLAKNTTTAPSTVELALNAIPAR